jgi:hypothetical protein
MWAPGGPISAQPKWLGLIQPNVKKKKNRGRPGLLGRLSAQPDPVGSGLAHIIIS